jgi:hypothetical protein
MGIQIRHSRTTSANENERWAGRRVWAIRIWYGLLSLWALSMAHGAVTLLLGNAAPGEHFGSGMVTALKLLAVGGALGICWTGGRSIVAFQALAVGLAAWLASERLFAVPTPIGSLIPTILVSAALWLLPLILLSPQRRQLLRPQVRPSAILLPLALAATVPLWIYAVRQGDLSISDTEDASSIGVVLAAQILFAALRPRGSRWLPRFVALATAWIGVLTVIWPHDLTSPGRAWGAVLICWALLFAGANELHASRGPARGLRSATAGRR